MENIKVSILCLCFNHEKYIRKCLDGFVMQECDFEYEVLIHDDASTDASAQIIKEYEQKKTALYSKKLLLIQRKTTLELLKLEIEQKKNDVEEYIASIDDSRMRRIVNMRFIDNLSWNQVADRIGGGNTEGSVKMAFQRFMKE